MRKEKIGECAVIQYLYMGASTQTINEDMTAILVTRKIQRIQDMVMKDQQIIECLIANVVGISQKW